MSDLSIYDEPENLISSDEYSDEEYDDLMNEAIGSQKTSEKSKPMLLPTNNFRSQQYRNGKLPKIQPRSRQFINTSKKRSIKWLNNKQRRNKYREHLQNIVKKKRSPTPELPVVVEPEKVALKPTEAEVVTLDISDIEITPEKTKPIADELIVKKNDNQIVVEDSQQKKSAISIENSTPIVDTQPKCQKRPRSPSPTSNKDCGNESKKHLPDKGSASSLYKEINEMFPKHEEIVGKHIKSSNHTINAIDENITRILLDIQTLNDILQAKEIEWNRLLHLKKVKEEILTRLVRNKHIMELKETQNDQQACSLSELKELEMYLSESNTTRSGAATCLTTTTQKLIENRANMKKEDLEKEKNNTNRLQSILVSSNILPRIDNSAKDNLNTKRSSSPALTSPHLMQSYQYLESKVKSNVGRQGPFKDVKSIIADFRQKNPDLLPRVGKRIKMHEASMSNMTNISKSSHLTHSADSVNELSIQAPYNSSSINCTPTLEKLLSTSSHASNSIHPRRSTQQYSQEYKLNNENQGNVYRLQNINDGYCNEVSITPITADNRFLQNDYPSKSELLRSALHTNAQQNSVYIDAREYEKLTLKDIRNNKLAEENMHLCQECKTHEARFVCAGCGNQWYCSRSCQISAWDKHSDVCNE